MGYSAMLGRLWKVFNKGVQLLSCGVCSMLDGEEAEGLLLHMACKLPSPGRWLLIVIKR